MSEAVTKILFVGDVHLGRRPAGAVENLEDHGVVASKLSAARAFESMVKLALEESVDAVVMAGDVIESERDRFEAYSHLERGTRRLVEAGIRVFGVAGNHDAIALPRLARRIPGFELIGESGRWAVHQLQARTGPMVELVGWSFTKNQYFDNPFHHSSWTAVETQIRRSINPVIGVLHADLEANGSRYAPIKRADLQDAPTDAFFLGHVHQPSPLNTARPLGYLGSLVGLDPGEPGARGPWLVSVWGRGRVEAVQVPLGPIRWERLEVSVEGLEPAAIEDQLHERLNEAFFQKSAELRTSEGRLPTAVGCRVALVGRTAVRTSIERFIALCAARPPVRQLDAMLFFAEKVIDETAVAIDLDTLKDSQSPLGLLAKQLLELEDEAAESSELVRKLEREIELVLSKSWRHLPGGETPPSARTMLRRTALRLLGQMVDAEPQGDLPEAQP